MEEVDFSYKPRPVKLPETSSLGRGYPQLSAPKTHSNTPWGVILVIIVLIASLFAYLAYEGYFKSDVDQEVNLEPENIINNEVNNEYEFNPQTENNHTIINDLTIKVYIEGEEVSSDVE